VNQERIRRAPRSSGAANSVDDETPARATLRIDAIRTSL
jgi:hypothetical protein